MKTVFSLFISYKFELAVFVFATIAVCSLFHGGLPPTHDGEYHVVRFYEFDKTLRSGSWYPVWAPDLNYTFGSPLLSYVYPFPNYTSSFFHIFGISFIDTFKINLILASYLGAFSSYYLGKNKFGVWGGILTSVFYTYAPYHFLDIYIRGSVGEVWALAFFPLCLLLLDRLIKKMSLLSMVLFAMSYSLVIFSHNILAVMFSFFAGSYSLLLIFQSENKKRTFFSIVQGFFVGLLLSSVFIVPALLEQKYVVGLKIFNLGDNFPELFQLLIPSWGSGFSGNTLENQMSFQIGLANLLIVALVLFGFFLKKIEKKKIPYILFFMTWFIFLFFLITPYSKGIWDRIFVMGYFQFPWRFLSLVILCVAILAGSITSIFKFRILYIALIAVAVIGTYSYAHPAYFLDRSDSYYTTRPNFIFGTNSIGDVFQTKWLSQQKNLPKASAQKEVRLVSWDAVKQEYKVNFKKKTEVVFNTAYFPGWNAYIDGKTAHVSNKSGKILVIVPKGVHTVLLQLEDTPIRFISKCISMITFLAILCILARFAMIQLSHDSRNR